MDGQMKRGILEMCILQVIGQGERYGYEIMKEITAVFPDVNESTAYAILRRLRGDGKLELIEGRNPEGDARRKYYSLTEFGRQSLDKAKKSWRAMEEAVARFGI